MVRQQLELLAAAGPLRCYVACDGPRTGNWAEAQAVASVQSVVAEYAKHLDLRTQFQEVNLGCGRGVSTAINWFFECETEGIILEDDCHPSAGFFAFCVELLERYRNVSHVMQIAGYNRLSPLDWIDSDYIFSNYGCQWGWATWRRAWDHFDLKMALPLTPSAYVCWTRPMRGPLTPGITNGPLRWRPSQAYRWCRA
jgi:hypothetical protein